MYSYTVFTQWYLYFIFQIFFTRLNHPFLGCKNTFFTAEKVFDFSFLRYKPVLPEIRFVAYLIDYLVAVIFGLFFRIFFGWLMRCRKQGLFGFQYLDLLNLLILLIPLCFSVYFSLFSVCYNSLQLNLTLVAA